MLSNPSHLVSCLSSSSTHKVKLYNCTTENHTSKVHLDLHSLLQNGVRLSGVDKPSTFRGSWAKCKVGTTFGFMTENDNVTGSHAPVTLGSAQPGQWSIRDTGGFFGPLTPNPPIHSPPDSPIPTPSQPPASSHTQILLTLSDRNHPVIL